MKVMIRVTLFLLIIFDLSLADAQVVNLSNLDSIIRIKDKEGKNYYNKGMYEEAESRSKEILELKKRFMADNPKRFRNNYLNLGNTYILLARYSEAIEYLDKAYELYMTDDTPIEKKAKILVGIGLCYHYRRDFSKAETYYKKAISLMETNNAIGFHTIITAYGNLGLIYFSLGKEDEGIKYHLSGLEYCKSDMKSYELGLHKLSYNLMLKNNPLAKKYFEERYEILTKKIDNPSSLVDYYNEYSYYMLNIERDTLSAKNYLDKALKILRENFHLEHHKYADTYLSLAKLSLSKDQEEIALNYIQLFFRVTVDDFNSLNFEDNPVLEGGNYKYDVINALNIKTKASFLLYLEKDDLKSLDIAINSILLAIDGINQTRFRIDNEESKFLITKSQISTFKLAQQVIYEKYKLTDDPELRELLFAVAEKGKSFSLLSSIRSVKAFEYGDIPKELLKREESLNQKISFYNELILNEKGQEKPRESHIRVWENYLFELGREYDELTAYFEENYPGYYNLKYDTDVISMQEVSNKLDKDDLVIEYSLTDSILFTYLMGSDMVKVFRRRVDSTLSGKCMDFYAEITTQSFSNEAKATFQNYSRLGYEIYSDLLEPIEEYTRGKNLIFIPDGAISFVPFDALLTEKVEKTEPDYYHLPYLILENAVSTSYSSTIHFNELINHENVKGEILAFAPDYGNLTAYNPGYSFLRQDDLKKLIRIPGVKEEVARISELTSARIFQDRDATETNFKEHATDYGVLHLAMHTILDDDNPLYSKLAFTQMVDTVNDGFLHTYEIYNMEFNANMAVLSSCGSGFGNFREGEGIQSLARGFAYAGCPSILMTLWEVADQSTVVMMERFYYHLRRGLSKSKALQLSKLEFLENADQLRSNPFFWSSYTIMGNSEPIFPNPIWSILLNIGLLLIPVPVLLILYKRYRKQAGMKDL